MVIVTQKKFMEVSEAFDFGHSWIDSDDLHVTVAFEFVGHSLPNTLGKIDEVGRP